MKKDIHPAYFPKASAKCGCGASFVIGSTSEKIEVEICSNCHPFYTGKEKLIDTAGKVEKFRAKREKAAAVPKRAKKVRAKKKLEKGKKPINKRTVVGKKKAKAMSRKATAQGRATKKVNRTAKKTVAEKK